MEQKVHVEAPPQRPAGVAPFGNQGGVGVVFIQEGPHLLPQADGGFLIGVVFHQAPRHIHPEAVAAHLQPEIHHLDHGVEGGLGFGRIGGLLPGLRRVGVGKAVVQGGLGGEEVHRTASVSGGDAPQTAGGVFHPVEVLPDGVGPEVTVGVLIFLRLHGL